MNKSDVVRYDKMLNMSDEQSKGIRYLFLPFSGLRSVIKTLDERVDVKYTFTITTYIISFAPYIALVTENNTAKIRCRRHLFVS